MEEYKLFYEITSVLILAGLIAMVISVLKQPSIIAFIITGLIVGPFGYYKLQESDVLTTLGTIGITLLLFMVGLELDFKQVRQLGKTVLYIGISQIVLTFAAGYAVVRLLGFENIPSLFIATALTFSSTIIVVKLLAEKKDQQSLYARIVVGFLIVQDFIAMGLLLFLGASHSAGGMLASLPSWQQFIITLVKALILFLVLVWLSRQVFPHLLKKLGKSDELLLVFSIAWALGLAAFMSLPFVGFSLEIGGFLAGLALANSQVHYEIGAKIKSIRDLFIIMFFIVFGSQLVFNNVWQILVPAIVLSLFVLAIKPLIVMIVMSVLGYKPRTSFFASMTMPQISEFGFILMAVGFKLGYVDGAIQALVGIVGIMTITLSSYSILYTYDLYETVKHRLGIFDFGRRSREADLGEAVLKDHIILVGANRLGSHLLSSVDLKKQQLVVVDFDPEVAERYSKDGVNVICGDITDSYIQDQVNLENAKLVISTVPDIKDNTALLDAVSLRTSGRRRRPKLIFAAQNEAEARHLYQKEIDYVISPHFIGGLHLARILHEDKTLHTLKKLKANHLKLISA